MPKTKIDKETLTQAVAKMRTAIDEFGEGLEESGIQWKSVDWDVKVRYVYDLCHKTVFELEKALRA
ncbi:hypothetical protein KAR91_72695, partial [Candidatus Pacearchaeota archaeon]|nr:hypothetical protein [Candidatus Pacearchaeota archaeon]